MPLTVFIIFSVLIVLNRVSLASNIDTEKDLLLSDESTQEPVSESLTTFYEKDLSKLGKEVFLKISKKYTEIVKDHNFKISQEDYIDIKDFHSSNPLEFMKIVKAFSDRNMTAFVCTILFSYGTRGCKRKSKSLFSSDGTFHQITFN
jgi:hypothetical protein